MKQNTLYFLVLIISSSLLQSEQTGKSLKLLYFTASWCGPCQLMKQKTWPNALVKKELEAFTFQSIDVDAEKKLAQQWSVRSMPTFLVIDPSGEIELARMSGFMDAFRMTAWLKEINTEAHQTLESILAARELAEENWAMITPLTEGNISKESLRAGQDALYKLLQHRDGLNKSDIKALNSRLQVIAKSHPEYITGGILHKDLQVRAYIARALKANDIQFNPWANQEERAEALAKFIESSK